MEDEVIHTLCQIQTCFVFQLPPRTSSGQYRAESFKDNQMWSGRLRVQASSSSSFIQLLENDGSVFANCPLTDGAVEKCPDSSRYFVIRIVSKQGQKAFIGIGFQDRSESFSFNAALEDCEKFQQGVGINDEDAGALVADQTTEKKPAKDFSLKEGETIRINIKKATKSATPKPATSESSGGFGLAPPPSSGGRRRRGGNK